MPAELEDRASLHQMCRAGPRIPDWSDSAVDFDVSTDNPAPAALGRMSGTLPATHGWAASLELKLRLWRWPSRGNCGGLCGQLQPIEDAANDRRVSNACKQLAPAAAVRATQDIKREELIRE